MTKVNIKTKLPYSIEEVWNKITNLQDQTWRQDISHIEIKDQYNFIEHTKDGYKTTFHITSFVPLQRYEFDMENDNMIGHWVGLFSYQDQMTVIELIEDIHVKKAFLKPFVKLYLKKQQKQFIADLKAILEKEST